MCDICAVQEKIAELLKRADANAKRNAELLELIKANRAKIDANHKAISERRAEIEKNAAAIGDVVRVLISLTVCAAANTAKILDTAFDG